MRAYWYDGKPGDQREPHESAHGPVEPQYLSKLGIIHFNYNDIADVNRLAEERGYRNRDEVKISPSTLPNYEEKIRSFYSEHLHEDEEIRYILDGSGFFDVRDKGDDWVRIQLEKGDLIIMPAGIYHRFTTDTHNWTHAVRLFTERPRWTPLNRGDATDKNEYRKQYLATRDGSA